MQQRARQRSFRSRATPASWPPSQQPTSPGASLPQAAALTSGLKPKRLTDTFSTAADESLSCDPKIESLSSSERSLNAAQLGIAGSGADDVSST